MLLPALTAFVLPFLSSQSPAPAVKFEVEELKNPNDGNFPISRVLVLVGGKKFVVSDINETARLKDPEEFREGGFPKGTVDAVSCWWAGGGREFALTRANGKVIISRRYLEEQVDNFPWQRVRSFSDAGTALDAYAEGNIVGSYAIAKGKATDVVTISGSGIALTVRHARYPQAIASLAAMKKSLGGKTVREGSLRWRDVAAGEYWMSDAKLALTGDLRFRGPKGALTLRFRDGNGTEIGAKMKRLR